MNSTKAKSLVLEDGSTYDGFQFGGGEFTYGEVVFNTSMTGYQEILTDPSYAGQIVVSTYPIIGNYGINDKDFESDKIQVSGFVVREYCDFPSHNDSNNDIDGFLRSQNIGGLAGIDTRALTKKIRTSGVMMGAIVNSDEVDQIKKRFNNLPKYDDIDYVSKVTTDNRYDFISNPTNESMTGFTIVVDDYGVKRNILRILESRGCRVVVMPAKSSAEEVLSLKPDGIVVSPGPGDPELLKHLVNKTKKLMGKLPILGICLGNQVLGCAMGGKTFKLPFGHRGGNHPVKDLVSGKVSITAQNHGYALDAESLPDHVDVTHVNLNDGTVEGIRHSDLPIMGIQFHSEASPGPLDNEYLFDRFLDLIRNE
ncbi:MAG: glutamine-hydrolyzing carbamoyl-phosphate synthase small subunit [SAR202 cluster bacterium]|nr:glutamine-hydrolyzing carbamoyl-phosphate synthase small subunit [SAR202 cluster bacterium]|tara:strand:+ start:127 stop:1227 length:1101 start_codon:yes stop_codon:yes gene_type:complete